MSFAQGPRKEMHSASDLRWSGAKLRVYDCSDPGEPALLRSLTPLGQGQGFSEYLDVVEDASGQSARVYMS